MQTGARIQRGCFICLLIGACGLFGAFLLLPDRETPIDPTAGILQSAHVESVAVLGGNWVNATISEREVISRLVEEVNAIPRERSRPQLGLGPDVRFLDAEGRTLLEFAFSSPGRSGLWLPGQEPLYIKAWEHQLPTFIAARRFGRYAGDCRALGLWAAHDTWSSWEKARVEGTIENMNRARPDLSIAMPATPQELRTMVPSPPVPTLEELGKFKAMYPSR